MVICLEQGADLHMAQLMPLPLTVSCFSKIQIGFTFLVPAHPGSPGQSAVKRVCVCVCVVRGYQARLRSATYVRGTARICCCAPCCSPMRPCSNRSTSHTRRAHGSKPVARCCSRQMGQKHGRTSCRFIDPRSYRSYLQTTARLS